MNDYKRTAQYYETDQMGIVHHSNYIRWFEEARSDFLEQCGYNYSKMEEDGVLLPVLDVSCRYRLPVKYGETVYISTNIKELNALKIVLEYKVYDKETMKVKTTGTSSHCFVDRSFKVMNIKKSRPDVYEFFNRCLIK